MVNNSYFVTTVMPGEHTVKAEGSTWGTNWYPGPVERNFTFSAGSSYYIRIKPVQTGSTKVQNKLTKSTVANSILGAALTAAIFNLPNWQTSITLMEMVETDIGEIEIRKTKQLK